MVNRYLNWYGHRAGVKPAAVEEQLNQLAGARDSKEKAL